jgi:hypothetical protein
MYKHISTPLRVVGASILLLALLLSHVRASAAPVLSGPPRDHHPASGPYTGEPTNIPAPITYSDPALTSLDGIWLGEVIRGSNIRTGPGANYPVDRTWPAGRRVLVYRTVTASNGEQWYQVGQYPNPDLYIWSPLVRSITTLSVPAIIHTGRWVDVNLTQQILIALEDGQPVLATQVSSGKAGHETPVGSWRIYWRLPLQDMSNHNSQADGDAYYNLKDVPWVQYFQTDGDSLHGTYWHDNFGTPVSHGCINLSYQDSQWLYQWASLGTLVEVNY